MNFLVNAALLWKIESFKERIEGLNPNYTLSGKYNVNFLVVLLIFGMDSLNPINPYPAISKSSVRPLTN